MWGGGSPNNAFFSQCISQRAVQTYLEKQNKLDPIASQFVLNSMFKET